MENNQLIKTEENQENSVLVNPNNRVYCSFKPKSTEERKKLFNSLESCDIILNDIVGQKITVKDVYIQEYPRTDKETGEKMSNGHRTIIFDDKGKTYVTISNYFFVTMAKLFNSVGTPDTWNEPMEIEITKRETKSGGKALGFKLV